MNTHTSSTVARQLTHDYKKRAEIFLSLDLQQQLAVLPQLSKYVVSQLLSQLPQSAILPLLEALDPDEGTDLLQTLPKRKQELLIQELSQDLQKKVSLLLEFDPKTAAGLMSLNYIQVDSTEQIADIGSQLQLHEKRTGKLPVIIVLHEGKLHGFLPIQKLLTAHGKDSVREHTKKIVGIPHTAGYQTVLSHFIEHPHTKVVVLDDTGHILGVLFADDILRAYHEQEGSNLYDFAGVSTEETVFASVKLKVKHRYKWLLINLATAFLAAFTVGLFNETISKFVLLAVYMPIVAGMGGNAATQTLAVMVRGIALNQITLETAWPAIKKEVLTGMIHGVMTGVVVALIVLLFNQDLELALVLSAAMILNLIVAGFFGTLVPLIMTKLGKDPATSASIFITTATDILGFLAFLGLATLVLK